ncbi:MAG: hypothetical protein RIQ52_76, partial [Pseudomonadota bacterium]
MDSMKNTIDDQQLCHQGRQVLQTEAAAILALCDRMETGFASACNLLLACKGRIVVTGMGKSGHIAGKIAATLASTGNPAFFVHPGEACHGDLGMITSRDTVLALSNSGETHELLTILPMLKRQGIPLVVMSGRTDSTLARQADVHLDTSVSHEACPMGLAPTASTTTMLALGDALAVAMLQARGFTPEDFAFSHPGGMLGRRLLVRVSDIMHSGSAVPVVDMDCSVRMMLKEMTEKKLGMTAVTNEQKTVTGIFTDGDVRRLLEK